MRLDVNSCDFVRRCSTLPWGLAPANGKVALPLDSGPRDQISKSTRRAQRTIAVIVPLGHDRTMNKAAAITKNAAGLIGQTPVMALSRAWNGPGRILAKAEFMQPGGSVKDRAALAIIEAARADGRLMHGAPVVEMTSGNMGAGLAVVCSALGHLGEQTFTTNFAIPERRN